MNINVQWGQYKKHYCLYIENTAFSNFIQSLMTQAAQGHDPKSTNS